MSVKEVMDTWTLQKNYPVVTINRGDDGSAIVTQVSNLAAVLIL